MKRANQLLKASLTIFLLLGWAGGSLAEEIERSFSGVKSIRMKTVSGDCIIEAGTGSEVKLTLKHTYSDDVFEAEIDQRGSRLILEERFRRSSWGSHRGSSSWHLIVPKDVEIDFGTASGEFSVEGVENNIEARSASGDLTFKEIKGEVRASAASGNIDLTDIEGEVSASTASGDVELDGVEGNTKASTASGRIDAQKVNGEIKFSAASGDVRASDITGEIKMSAASGDVTASNVNVEERSSFSAASGNVEVSFGSSPKDDVKVSAASGDAELDYDGNSIQGYIEMTARARRGRIRAPFDFDKEETYEKWGQEYVTKSVQKGESSLTIEISTASGTATLKQ